MNDTQLDIKSVRNMLNEMGDLAEQSSLTGSLASGAGRLTERFNQLLETLIQQGYVPAGLFSPLPTQGADYGPLGVETRMLASYISPKKGKEHDDDDLSQVLALAPFVDASDLAAMVREMIASGHRPPKRLLASIAPFLHKSDLGEFLRYSARIAEPPSPPEPVPPAPATSAQPVADLSLAVPSQEISELDKRETIHQLIVNLRSGDFRDEEKDRIAARIADLLSE